MGGRLGAQSVMNPAQRPQLVFLPSLRLAMLLANRL
jgi:hypothetical protein